MAAQFEIRQLRLPAARKLLGTAIGMCPKAKLFRCSCSPSTGTVSCCLHLAGISDCQKEDTAVKGKGRQCCLVVPTVSFPPRQGLPKSCSCDMWRAGHQGSLCLHLLAH